VIKLSSPSTTSEQHKSGLQTKETLHLPRGLLEEHQKPEAAFALKIGTSGTVSFKFRSEFEDSKSTVSAYQLQKDFGISIEKQNGKTYIVTNKAETNNAFEVGPNDHVDFGKDSDGRLKIIVYRPTENGKFTENHYILFNDPESKKTEFRLGLEIKGSSGPTDQRPNRQSVGIVNEVGIHPNGKEEMNKKMHRIFEGTAAADVYTPLEGTNYMMRLATKFDKDGKEIGRFIQIYEVNKDGQPVKDSSGRTKIAIEAQVKPDAKGEYTADCYAEANKKIVASEKFKQLTKKRD
jgi:hypothetical protein